MTTAEELSNLEQQNWCAEAINASYRSVLKELALLTPRASLEKDTIRHGTTKLVMTAEEDFFVVALELCKQKIPSVRLAKIFLYNLHTITYECEHI